VKESEDLISAVAWGLGVQRIEPFGEDSPPALDVNKTQIVVAPEERSLARDVVAVCV
jgi:hypothetical protein